MIIKGNDRMKYKRYCPDCKGNNLHQYDRLAEPNQDWIMFLCYGCNERFMVFIPITESEQ